MQQASEAVLAPVVDWERVDTVLLDMDGTLLDLGFDNYFWQELVPERFAARHGLSPEAALTQLTPRFTAKQGTLDWYCTDYWTRELGLDIAALKHEVAARVCFLPGARQFLCGNRFVVTSFQRRWARGLGFIGAGRIAGSASAPSPPSARSLRAIG